MPRHATPDCSTDRRPYSGTDGLADTGSVCSPHANADCSTYRLPHGLTDGLTQHDQRRGRLRSCQGPYAHGRRLPYLHRRRH